LTDVTRRENRFMHVGIYPLIANHPFPNNFPNAVDLNPNFAGTPVGNTQTADLYNQNPQTPRHDVANTGSQYRWVLFDGGRQGQDVILSHVLSFDIRVYDPYAVVYVDVSGSQLA